MIDSVTRPRLAKGLSYVLTTSQLADALADARIDCHINLVYWSPRGTRSILEGAYWLPSENVPHPRVYVGAGAVPSAMLPDAAKALSNAALRQFVRWLGDVLALPENSPALAAGPYFNAAYTEDGLAITDHPAYKVRHRRARR